MFRAILLSALLATACFAQSQPNFSGTWKLNVSKSDFGMMPAPDSRTDVIEHAGDTLKDQVAANGQQGKQEYLLTFKTDGTETVNKIADREVKVSAKWDGPAMVVTTKLDFQGTEILIKSNWTLSSDGATLTQAAHIASPMGEMDQKAIFEKQ
ncbi:MAG TPA: hypothetical protein VKX45_17060 [Bryobacteraceae bacterium]|nr:hypothetical protein [Bryobacteraceae bacterium]